MNVTCRIALCVSSFLLLAQAVRAQPPEEAATTDGADAKPGAPDAGDVDGPSVSPFRQDDLVRSAHPKCLEDCREAGRCHYDGDDCIAFFAVDCAASKRCRDGKDCYLDREEGRCDKGKERNSKPAIHKPPRAYQADWRDNGKERNSTGAMVAGIVLIGVGAVLAITGVFVGLEHLGAANGKSSVHFFSLTGAEEEQRNAGGLAVAGAACAVAGITLAIIGGVKGKRRSGASAAPDVILAPGNATLVWSF